MSRYRKKPVVVEAMQWEPENLLQARLVVGWLKAVGADFHHPDGYRLAIRTLEGEMLVSPGDMVIKGVQGEFYPCKPDIFAATYELAEDS